MNIMKQISAVTMMSLRTLKQRLGTSLVVIAGTAGVVAVLLSILALSNGLKQTISAAGRPERAVVLYRGAQSEAASSLTRATVLSLLDKNGIQHDSAGKVRATADVLGSLWLPHSNDATPGSVTLRGVSAQVQAVRPEIKLLAGRMFEPGLKQVIVGQATQRGYKGLAIGDKILTTDTQWEVVGVFASGGSVHESEIWSDAESVLATLHRNSFNSITAWVENDAGYQQLKAAVEADPTLTVDVHDEIGFYASQSSSFSSFISIVANVIGVIMAIGAVFGAINAMYTAISARTGEIATLRAIGFSPVGIVMSVFAESLLLALSGALIGAALAWLFFNGNTVSTIGGGNSLSQVVFDLHIGVHEVSLGIGWSLVLGLVGGLFPAIRAARLPVVVALRGA